MPHMIKVLIHGVSIVISCPTIKSFFYGPAFVPPTKIAYFHHKIRDMENQHLWLTQVITKGQLAKSKIQNRKPTKEP